MTDKFLYNNSRFSSNIAPTGTGNIVQKIGTATSATTINFEPQDFIVLA